MESSQEIQQPNNQQSLPEISSQRRSSSIQDDQDLFCFLKSEEKSTRPRPFFSKNGLSQDIIQVTDAEPDICLEVFYALYQALWPQIENQSNEMLKDAWDRFIGSSSLKGILWSPEKLMEDPRDLMANFMKGEGENDIFLHLDEVVESIRNLNQKLKDYPDEILHKEEILASLELVEEFYLRFRNKVKELVTIIIENKDPLINYHALEDLLEPKAVMMSNIFTNHWAYRIPRKKAKTMLSLNKWKSPIKNHSNEESNHRVAALPGSDPLVYFKANGANAIHPEKEFMLYSLYRQLQIPVPETALLVLTNVFGDDANYYYAVQASEAVSGESVLEILRDQEIIFEQAAYAKQAIGALLTNPSDGKPQDFKYSQKYQIFISINNGSTFKPEFLGEGDEKIVNVKSILYLLPQIDSLIPEAIKNFFTSLDISLTTLSWLQSLSQNNKEYRLLFSRLAFQKTRHTYESLRLQDKAPLLEACLQEKVHMDPEFYGDSFYPQILVSKSFLSDVKEKLQIIAKTFGKNSPLSTQMLFEEISPVLGKYYRKLREEFPDIEEAKKALLGEQKNDDGVDYSNLRSLLDDEELESLSYLSRSKSSFNEDLIPEVFFNEYKNQLSSGECPIDQFIKRHNQRKRRNSLNVRDVLEELQLLIQEGLTDLEAPRDLVDFREMIYRMVESDPNPIKEITLLFSNLPNAELKWLFTLEKYFSRKVETSSLVVTGVYLRERTLRISESQKQYLFDEQGNIKKNKTLGGKLNVTCFPETNPEFYLKQYPELPGYEFASLLFMRMIGITHLPYQELIITNKDPKYPVLLTEAVYGNLVCEIWNDNQAFNNLDPIHTGLLIIAAIILNPEDGKEDNFMLSPDNKYLIPIDNDRYFLPSTFQQEGSLWNAWTVNTALQTKTLLFCLDEMNRPIHADVRKKITSLDFNLLLISWMRELEKVDDRYKSLVDEKQQDEFLKNKTALRISFYSQFIHHLDWKVKKIQDLLNTKAELTPLHLLKAVEPFAARSYQNSFQPGSTLQSRFTAATSQLYDAKTNLDGSRMSIRNTQDILKIINKPEKDLKENKMGPSEALELLEQIPQKRSERRKMEQNFLCELEGEESLWTKLFGNPVLEANLKNFFLSPSDGLALKGSKFITSKYLESLIAPAPDQCAKIKFLSLPNSPLLDSKTIQVLVDGCPNLEYLNVSGCVKLEEIVTEEGEFPVLTRLEAKDCLNLKKLKSASPMRILRVGTHQKIEICIEKNMLDIFAISTQTNQFDFVLEKGENFEIKPLEKGATVDRFLQDVLLKDGCFEKYFKSPKITIGSNLISSPNDLGVFLTSIDLRDSDNHQEEIKKTVQSILPSFKSLQLPKLSQGETSLLEDLVKGDWPGLTYLNLSENEIYDEGLMKLSQGKWPQLEILNLSSNKITKKGFLNFALNTNWLNLKEIKLSEASLPITDFPNNLLPKNWDSLVELDLSSVGITPNEMTSIVNLSKWPNLKHLNLSDNEITDEGLIILSQGNWPLLESLNLSRIQITSARIQTFVNDHKWPNLKALNLSENDINNEGFVALSKGNLPLLEKLNLKQTRVTNKGLLNFYLELNWPSLKEIEFPSCIDLNLASCLHQRKFSQVERLELENEYISSEEILGITRLYKFQQLKYLKISDIEIFDQRLPALALGEWPLLEELHLRNIKITEKGIDPLIKMNLTNLKKLDISENAISDKGLKTLSSANWPLLQHLVYEKTQVTLKGNITFLENLQWPNLLHLEHSLTESFYNYNKNWALPEVILAIAPMYYKTEPILVTVLDMTWLNSKEIYLSIWHNGLKETIMILPREKLNQLENLKLSVCTPLIQPRLWPCDIKTLDLSNTTSFESLLLENWPKLQELNLSQAEITTSNIGILVNQINGLSLKKLDISHNRISDEGLRLLLSEERSLLLESLNLRNISMTSEGINSLLSISNLKALDISDNPIYDQGLRLLASGKLPELESLNLSKISITAEAIKSIVAISDWPNLKVLDVSENSISDKGLKFLSGAWTSLESLSLKNINITAEGVKNMIKHSEWSNMKRLDISNNPISDDGLEVLSSGKWPLLENLSLKNTLVTEIGIESMVKISEWSKIKTLDVSDNSIHDTGLKSLGASSGKWSELESLNLRNISITAEGVKDLATKWPSLKILDVSNNSISDQGLEFLSSGNWSLLENLSLRNTSITQIGIESMIKISKWSNIKMLDVSDNSIHDKGLESLSSAKWPELESLKLARTSLTIQGVEKLAKTFEWINLKEVHIREPEGALESVKVQKLISERWPNVQLTQE